MNFNYFNLNRNTFHAADDGNGNSNEPQPEVVMIDDAEYKLDDEGNALAEDGTIFKTKDEIDALSTDPEFIIIDDVKYGLDKDGNAVDDKGVVVKTKADIDALSDEPIEDQYFSEIKGLLNVSIKDDKGQDVVYEKSPKGVASFVNDAINTIVPKIKDKAINELFAAHPDLHNIYRHKLAYGTVENYKQQIDYRQVKLEENNVEQLKNIILHEKMIKGESKDTAMRFITFSEKENTLVADAKAAKAYLDNYSKVNQEKVDAQIKANSEAETKRIQTYWNDVKDKVTVKGKISVDDKEYTIPAIIQYSDNGKIIQASREDFFNYMSQPVRFKFEDGSTRVMTRYEFDAAQEDARKTAVDYDIMEAFNLFTRKKATNFVDAQLNAQKVKEARKLYTRNTQPAGKTHEQHGSKNVILPVK